MALRAVAAAAVAALLAGVAQSQEPTYCHAPAGVPLVPGTAGMSLVLVQGSCWHAACHIRAVLLLRARGERHAARRGRVCAQW